MPVLFDSALIDALHIRAQASLRRRAHHNLHASLEDPCQRLLVAIEPDSCVQPHRHLAPSKSEVLIVLRGRLACFTFDAHGHCTCCPVLAVGGGLEVAPGEWHTVLALDPGTLFFEAKAGPYRPLVDAERAAWAPGEQAAGAAQYREWLRGLCTPP